MFGLSPAEIALFVTAPVSAFFLATKMFGRDEMREDRKRRMIDLAAHMKELGLVRISDILTDMVVGDYSAIVHKVKALADDIKSGGTMALLDELFTKQLLGRVRDPARKAEIIAALAAVTNVENGNGISAANTESVTAP